VTHRSDATLIAMRDLQANKPRSRTFAAILALLIVGGGYGWFHDSLHPKDTSKKKKAKATATKVVNPGDH
jgi:hypothetical protein